jgi:hypothetical protein
MESISLELLSRGLAEVGSTLIFLIGAIVVVELVLYFLWEPLGALSRWIDRRLRFLGNPIRHIISIVLIVGVLIFAVGAISVGRTPSPWAPYWPLAVVALLAGVFVSPVAPTLFSKQFRLSYMLLIPAIVGLLLLVIFPLLWEVSVSFTNLSPKQF